LGKWENSAMYFLSKWSGVISLVAAVILMFGSDTVAAQEKSFDEWQYEFQINAWLPTIKPTLPTGETLNWSLSDLLSNLDMMAQLGGGARKGKWSIAVDVLYINLGDKRTISGEIIDHPVELEANLDLRALPFSVIAGYQVAESEKNRIDIIGGVRYIYIRVPITLSLGNLQQTVRAKIEIWDGIVGLQGKTTLNDQWYFDYYGDIGTGQSDITWQIKAGFGYNFNKWTALFGYRHLRWDYERGTGLKDLTITGPYIAAKWTF